MAKKEREALADSAAGRAPAPHDLGVAFAGFEARNFGEVPVVDEDPGTYVRETEQRFAPPDRSGGRRIARRRRPEGTVIPTSCRAGTRCLQNQPDPAARP